MMKSALISVLCFILIAYSNILAQSGDVDDHQEGLPKLCSSSKAIRIVVYRVDYLRIWDADKTANRTTRAIDPLLRQADRCHTEGFEDNARSRPTDMGEGDPRDNSPRLLLSGKGSTLCTAHIKVKCAFEPDIGEHVLWEVHDGPSAIDGLSWLAYAQESAGTFESGDTVDVHFSPPIDSGESIWPEQVGDDVIIVAGMDLDHSGSLEESEYLGDLTFGVNIITKAQWDQADANLAWYKINLAAICYPWAAEFMDNFLDANMFVAADAVWNVPLSCFHAPGFETCWPLRADGKYEYWPEGIDLKANDSLGCDQVNETISMVRSHFTT